MTARILVVADGIVEAELIGCLLRAEYGDLAFSTLPERAVEDFEQYRPALVILAFHALARAERYHLKLYGHGTLARSVPHRSLLLCRQDELQRGYALCRRAIFDDYLPFWPVPDEAPCLLMAVHRALRQMPGQPAAADFAAQARRLAGLEAALEQGLAQGSECIRQVAEALAGAAHGAAPDPEAAELRLMEIGQRPGFQLEAARPRGGPGDGPARAVGALLQPLGQWIAGIREKLAPQLAAARTLQALARRVRPLVLVVDDDEFQIKLLAQLLGAEQLELVFASSGAEALALLRKCRPELILMDVNLPDFDGLEVTRRLKTVEHCASIPVIMITGQSGKQVVIDSLKAGAADFVVKPFDKSTLLGKVHRFL